MGHKMSAFHCQTYRKVCGMTFRKVYQLCIFEGRSLT